MAGEKIVGGLTLLLNAVTGRGFWAEGGDAAQARTRYQDWWGRNADKLVWDPALRGFATK